MCVSTRSIFHKYEIFKAWLGHLISMKHEHINVHIVLLNNNKSYYLIILLITHHF